MPDALRDMVAARLVQAKAPPPWVSMVREPVALEQNDEQRIFGESLPAGLRLVR